MCSQSLHEHTSHTPRSSIITTWCPHTSHTQKLRMPHAATCNLSRLRTQFRLGDRLPSEFSLWTNIWFNDQWVFTDGSVSEGRICCDEVLTLVERQQVFQFELVLYLSHFDRLGNVVFVDDLLCGRGRRSRPSSYASIRQ